jgi:iron complex outermembrane receptor protein
MRLALALLALAATAPAPASSSRVADTVPTTLPPVVAVGDPMELQVPASLDRVDARELPARAGASVSELLQRVPGVAARDRENLAQDVQVTIRGFGARTTFGVRGLRIYVDGIPASMPDGQGQVSHVPLAAIAGVDVLRGPFSALYGNASGGVVQFFSKAPAARATLEGDGAAGSDGFRRLDLAWTGPWSGASAGGYRLDVGRLRTDGFRVHSRARRDLAQARFTGDLGSGAQWALTANGMDLQALDPQGLTAGQVRDDPRAASAGALLFDTRKQVRQRQAGWRLQQPLGAAGTLEIGGYVGGRKTWQMLSIPAFAQAAPGSGGGVVDLDRDFSGADLRWTIESSGSAAPMALTLGLEVQRSREHRLGFENFDGDRLGVVGALRRDQDDGVRGSDAFAEARWRFRPRWQATLGVRRSRVAFRSRDHYIAPGNPDDSGALEYAFTTPVAGLLFQPAPTLDVYANAGRGFETPSASELAYRADGGSGLNDGLRPSRTRSYEAGLRWHRDDARAGVAAFDSRTRDELVVAANEGGRSVYRNADHTRRRGLELSASGSFTPAWRYAVAATSLDARDDGTLARIAGTASRSGWAELRWSPNARFGQPGLDLFLSGTGNSRIAADDANTAWAPGYATFDLGAERRWRVGRRLWTLYARVDNVSGRRGIGSVIVNDGNGRFFEPAPGRTWMLGVRVGADPALR